MSGNHSNGEKPVILSAGKLANKGMDIAELGLYVAGVVATLASAFVATTYLKMRSKTKGN